MAINYTTLFTKIGKIIGRSNSYASLSATTLPADLVSILAAYGTGATTFGDAAGPVNGLTNSYASFQSNVTSWRTSLLPYIQNTLVDPDTVLSQLNGLTNTAISAVLAALIQDMTDNAQTVKGSIVTLGTPTAGSGNIGNGSALVDKVLDGVSVPVTGGFSSIRYAGINSELAVPSETMQLTCTSDSFSGGASEGSEQWSWTGGQKYGQFDYHTEGSGSGPSIQTANGNTTLNNLGFENFTVANTPDNWTIAAGAAGTDIFKETSTIFRGSAALRFTGTGNAQPSITQALSASLVKSRQRWLFTIQARKGGSVPGAGNLTIKFTGTGYSAASSEKIDIALTSLTTSYATYSFYLNIPATVPADLKLNISITGTNLATGANIYLDSGTWSPVTYFGGINAVVLAGTAPWTVGDRLTFTVVNDTGGQFSNFFRRGFYCQMPSKTDASQSIADSLAN